tara:strand:- start:3184 stop:5994 length:2811 start_codon:yes stop_codon:yes gene_type:complete
MSNGSIDYAMPDFQDPFKGFREELGNIETKRKQSQEKAFKMAEMIEMADSATMFGNDYSIATKWAQNLTDNLSSMSSSTEGMVQFAQQANMLKSFIDGSETYRTENVGSVKDGPQAGNWQGAVQRNISGVNPYGDQADTNSMSEYESRYKELNESLDVAFDESGSPIIRKGGREMAVSQYQRPENPFMPSLAESLFSESGFNYYDGVQDGFKNTHVSAEAAKTWAENSLVSDPKKIRGIVNSHLKTRDTNMTLDEAMSGNNTAVVREALDGFLDDVGTAWNTRHGEEFENLEDTLFTGGFSAPEGMETTTAGFINPSESGLVDDYTQATGLAVPFFETLGFSRLRTLATPIDSEYADELEDGERITSIEVDRNGDIHASLEVVTEVWGEDDPQHVLEPTLVKEKRPVTYTQNEAMHASLKNYLGAGTPQDVYGKMMLESLSNSKAQKAARIQRTFDSAVPAEELRTVQPTPAPAEATPPSTEAAPSSTETTPASAEAASISASDGERSRIPLELGRNEAVSEQELNDELGKLKNPLMNARTGEMATPSGFVSDLFSDALAAGYDPDLIRSVFESPDFTLQNTGRGDSQLLSSSQYEYGNMGKLRSKAERSQGTGGTLLRAFLPGMTPAAEHRHNYRKEREKAFDKFEELAKAASPAPPVETFAGQESTSGIEGVGRPTDLESPAPVVEPVALEDAGVNPAAEPIQTNAPEAAAVIQNFNAEATNPNTGSPVTVDASAPEKQESAITAFGGIIPLNAQEADIQDYIQELFTNVVPSDSTWLWDNAQEQFKAGNNPDPVPAWCAVWVADMLMKADPDFDFSAVESEKYGQKGSLNRTRARHYETLGEAVSKTGDRYDAQVGDIVIKRSDENGHHVGFFAGYAENGDVLILGGNQNDSLNVTPYPSSSIQTVRRIDVAAIRKEDVEKISVTMNSTGETN